MDRYWDSHFQHNPSEATAAGFHQHDTRLEDYSRAGVQAEIRDLRSFLRQLENFPSAGLDRIAAADREIAISLIRSQLHDLEAIRMWEKDPDLYSSGPSNSIFLIMARKYAPPETRLRSAIARLRQIPAVLDAARANLKNPPRIYTQVALEQLPGIIGFFRNDVPKAFEEVADETLLAEFRTANQRVIEALAVYQKYLNDEVLPRSSGDFRIGAENFRKKLLYEEMVDTPLDELRSIGLEDLRRNQQRFRETAAIIDASRPPREVFADLEKDHPAAGELLQNFRDVLGGLRQFLLEKRVVIVPSPKPPLVEETPPFARALTFASMDTPGAFEQCATESFFNVTLPEPDDSPEEAEELLAAFNRSTITSTAIHEVYPGHYLQYLWAIKAPSKFRQLLWTSSGFGSNAEGWAHYAEQMMLDEGYGNGNPRLRLGQIQDALLRNARFLVGLEMHTGAMTYEQGIEFFVNEAYMTRGNAERETKRGTSDPTYLIYTLGKLEILKLREEYKKLRGDKFTLQEFHDTFLRQGHVPLRVIRKEMLSGAPTPSSATQSSLSTLVDEFIAAFFHANPTPATLAGIHDYDALVEDYSPAGVRAQVRMLRDFERRFEQVTANGRLETDDRELALSFIRSSLLRLEELRMWERNPGTYSSLATNTIFVIMSRDFAPAEVRLRSVIARQRRIPRLLARAQTTLKNPPRIYTETALLTLPGILGFFRDDVPGAFASVKDAALQAEFRSTNRQVIQALSAYQGFLKQNLLPRSRGDFRIGAERFRKKLLYDEMVTTPLPELLDIAYKDLRRNQQAFVETAGRIDPARAPQEVLDDIERDHPAPAELLASVRGLLGGLRDFVTQHNIIELPSDRTLRVEETPPFLRATSFASMDAPGAFEKNVNEAFYHAALPDPAATPEQIESHMRSFSYVGLVGTSIHEAYPGHFTQYLWQDRAPSRLRLFLATDFSTLGFGFAWTNVEGWAHYTEQMLLDEGYGNGDPKLRLSQLQDALLRDARFVVGIEMHTGKMTYEQGIEFFRREAYQPQVAAKRETRRGTADPTYLVYTLGKLQILELREEYKKVRGASYSLRDFHDRYMRQGSVPNAVIRRAFLAP
ncbi:MAG: DUF885 domain-containing protein [Acidobacteria bacterium]|nr:DUF885 domain-containing protein [Acidobacteriota bacterium]